jgi:hypothetical protein
MLEVNKKKTFIAYLIVCFSGIGVIVLGLLFELLLLLGDYLNLLNYNLSFVILICASVVGIAMMIFSSAKLWLKLKRRSPQI